MAVYFSVFGILAILSYKELFGKYSVRAKRYTLIIISVAYIVLSSIYRGPMGDFYVYEEEFIKTDATHLTNIAGNHFEYLYELLSVIVRRFTSSYAIFRMVVAIIVIYLWYKIYIYKPTNNFNKYIITMLLSVWALTFGNIFIVRSTISVSICMFSLRYIIQKKPLKFLVCTCFAVGFHTMSIIWLPAYFIYNNKKIRKYLYILILMSLLFSQSMPTVILFVCRIFGTTIYNRIAGYISYGLDNTFGMAPNRLYTLVKALANIGLLLLVFQTIIFFNNKRSKVHINNSQNLIVQRSVFNNSYNLYLCGVLIYVVALFTSLALSRAALPYTALQYILLPQVFECSIFKKKRDRKLVFVVFIAYLLVRLLFTILGSHYVPFMNYEKVVS